MLSIDNPPAKRHQRGFPVQKVSYGTRGNASKTITLAQPLERTVKGRFLSFFKADIIPGRENRIVDTVYSFTYGMLRVFDLNEKSIYSEKIRIVIEDEKYIPMELHPEFMNRWKYFEKYKPRLSTHVTDHF